MDDDLSQKNIDNWWKELYDHYRKWPGEYPVPVTPYTPIVPTPFQPSYPYPNNPIGSEWSYHCPVCGIDMSGPMGYVCGNMKCPYGVRYSL